ncbi:hypothetical protein LPB140_06200 [Sphingorhabdus lutea]|uniref:BioF2-like acetyltransferase domain-containing protein n=1 Tax=Sphingorhabdus lutea TaxID=1913578 RepID=A0A1L3JBC7_9SPHN|nr:GNAT family N-acetyltransferase [Sphingorhabdus lutea]APG62447.1 hypothetical protein LPB140_06200 [Sphingorhabdus lutea]
MPKSEHLDNILDLQAKMRGGLDRDAQPHLFNRIDWLDYLIRYAMPKDRQYLFLTSGGDNARAVLPLYKHGFGQYHSLSNWYNFTFQPIFSGCKDLPDRMALLRAIAVNAHQKMWHICLTPVPDEDDITDQIITAFTQSGWIAYTRPIDENHILRLNGRSFDEYWATRPGQLRNTVKRKAKKNAVSIRIDKNFTPENWRDYEKIYAKSWKPGEGNPVFLQNLAKNEAEYGSLRLGLAYADDVPVAAQFWTVENGHALIHKLAHDEKYKNLSAGSLLSAALFQHVIDVDKVDIIDFGTGSDPYKKDWMEEVRHRNRINLYWPAHPCSWPYIVKNKLVALAERKKNGQDS